MDLAKHVLEENMGGLIIPLQLGLLHRFIEYDAFFYVRDVPDKIESGISDREGDTSMFTDIIEEE